jgi:crotonobetainyl-CoA:carnitine CoA-transferase CaiB-like acyl-CoA transferase
MPGPLSHLRVLDLSRVLAGPWASQLLADLGADVIKVERPDTGDDTRHWGPPYLRGTDEAAYFLAANRGKRSLTLDLATPDGQDIARRLATQSDVLLENHKAGALARHGLAWDDLRPLNPGLVYCSITGYGQTGPNAGRAGYDFAIQAEAGLMSVTGERDDRPGGGPQKVGVAVSDLTAGLYAAVAILAALAHRDRTGQGQHIDLALFDAQIAALANVALNYLVSGDVPPRWGNAHANIVPYNLFATADRPIVLAIGNDAQFARFCDLAGRPDLARDSRFATSDARVRQRDACVAALEPVLRARAAAHWLAACEAAGVPAAPVNDVAQAFASPQAAARGLRLDLPHPTAGTVPLVANPIRFSATPVSYDHPPPLLGQHTDAILRERLGLRDDDIAELRRRGVL